MAFIIKKHDLSKLHKEATKEFSFNDDLKISFKSLANPKFQRAYGIIQQKIGIDVPLNADTIANINDDELTADEALLFAVGEHLIHDWTVEDEHGEKLPINGDNFVLLTANVDDSMAFFSWCMACAGEIAQEVAKQNDITKKKPSKGGNGK
ncbi:hypothetical protein [Moraxella boevrei]|uniref:hypothetical protein n=1 Tax=Faucicola boevrei TaxID=346665 RepID=UPI003735C7C3